LEVVSKKVYYREQFQRLFVSRNGINEIIGQKQSRHEPYGIMLFPCPPPQRAFDRLKICLTGKKWCDRRKAMLGNPEIRVEKKVCWWRTLKV